MIFKGPKKVESLSQLLEWCFHSDCDIETSVGDFPTDLGEQSSKQACLFANPKSMQETLLDALHASSSGRILQFS